MNAQIPLNKNVNSLTAGKLQIWQPSGNSSGLEFKPHRMAIRISLSKMLIYLLAVSHVTWHYSD